MPHGSLSTLQTNLYVDRIAVDLPNVPAASSVDHDVTLPTGSVQGGDQNFVIEARHSPDLATGLAIAQAWVTAADTLRLRIINTTAGAVNPAAGTLRVAILRVVA